MVYYGIKDCCKLAFYSKVDGKLVAYFPYGNSLAISISGDKVEALAQGTTQITWQSNRKATCQIDTQVINDKLLSIILGGINSTLSSGTMAQFEQSSVGTSTPTYTLQNTPSTGTLSVFLTEADGSTVKTELTAIGSAPTATQYSISGSTLTFNATNAGAKILCIYAKDGTSIEQTIIKADQFAQAYKIVGIGTVKDVNGVNRIQEITIPNATAQSNADFTYSATEASSWSFTFDLASDPSTMNLVTFKSL